MAATGTSEDFSVGLWKTNATTQIISASISFLASLLVVASTGKSFFSCQRKYKDEKQHVDAGAHTSVATRRIATRFLFRLKITSPYRRIIFLISFSDILYSLAWITGPFMAQKTNPQALWAVSDSNAACVVNGLFIAIGTTTSLLYYVTLCYFYYCKISKRMTDEQFTKIYEKKIHIAIAFIAVAGACLGIATKTFNTSTNGLFCGNNNRPAGCNQQPEIYGGCDPEVKKFMPFFIYVNFTIAIFSFTVIMYSIIRLVHSVLHKDKKYGDLPSNPTPEQLHKYNVRKQLLRETMVQAIMYTSSWFICQSAPVASVFLHYKGMNFQMFPAAFQIYYAAIVPLNSAVNVFIFTRPAVRHVRRVDPSISRLEAFYMVLKAGGEAPDMRDSSSMQQLQQLHQRSEAYGRGEVNEYYGCDFGQGLDSLNVELLGSLEEMSRDNVAYRSEDKWSHNLGGFSDLNMICEEEESVEDRFQVSSMSGPSVQVLNTNEFESGLSVSMNTPSTSDIMNESGISVSNVESFEDEGK